MKKIIKIAFIPFLLSTCFLSGCFFDEFEDKQIKKEENIVYAGNKIFYDYAGGACRYDNPISYKEGSIQIIYNPEKNGYEFDGWLLAGKNIGKDITTYGFTGDIELVATYRLKQYTITYLSKYGNLHCKNPSSYNVEDDDIVLNPAQVDGYIFYGWYLESDPNNIFNTINMPQYADLVLCPKLIPEIYTITIDPNGGSVYPLSCYATYGQIPNVPIPKGNQGKVFLCYKCNGKIVDLDQPYKTAGDSLYVAIWLETK